MCYNENVSIITYIVGIIGCILLIYNNYIPEAIFYFFVIQMQLIEFMLWKNQLCNNININISKLGILINHMEPIILYIGIYFFSKKVLPIWIHYMMLLYLVGSIIYTIKVFKNECTTVTPDSSPHLHWKWNEGKFSGLYYTLFLTILVILSIYGIENGIIMSAIILCGFITSFYIYGNKHSIGAMWCFYAAIAPYLSLILYK